MDGNLGEDRHDFCNAAGDFCSSCFTSSAPVESAMTAHLLCSAEVAKVSPLALGLVLFLRDTDLPALVPGSFSHTS